MLSFTDIAFADNEEDLSEILDGFEEDTAVSDDDMDVLNGFDNLLKD